MNINFIKSKIADFKDFSIPALTPPQKKILVIASIVFSCLAVLILWRKCFFKAQKQIKEPENKSNDKNLKKIPTPPVQNQEIEGKTQNLEPVEVLLEESPELSLKDELMERIHSAKSTSKLYRQAEKGLKEFNGATLKLVMVDPDKAAFGASSHYSCGEIWISSALDADKAFSHFILMLANMTQAAQFDKIHKACLNKELSREDYALEMDKTVHRSTFIHTTVIKYAIAEKGEEWRKYDLYHHSVLDPIGHTTNQKAGGLSDYYLKYWDSLNAQYKLDAPTPDKSVQQDQTLPIMPDAVDKSLTLLRTLLERIHSAKATLKLYRQAEKELKEFNGASLKILMVDREKATFGALCNHTKGEIWISSDLDVDKAFTLFIFELANMTQAAQFYKIHKACLNKELSREDYALEMELIEHMSTFIHSTTLKYAIAEKGEEWRKYDCYHPTVLDPIKHMANQMNNGHSDYYLKCWDVAYAHI